MTANFCAEVERRDHENAHGGVSTWVMPNGSLVCSTHSLLNNVMGRLVVEAHRTVTP